MKHAESYYLHDPHANRIEMNHRANEEDSIGSLAEQGFEDPDVEHMAILSSN